MPLNDTLLEDQDSDELVRPAQMGRIGTRSRGFDLSDDADLQLKDLARAPSRFQAAPTEEAKPEKPLGLMGTIREGTKGTLRALGATADTMQGDAQGVVTAAKEQSDAPRDPDLEKFYAHIEERKQALGENPSLWEGIKAVGGAAIDNPRGFGLMVAEQLPNSGVALGAGAAGALAGSLAGPIGTVVGGLGGLAAANIGLETGHKALEAAQDLDFSPDDRKRVLREGLVKGSVISTVDAGTLGITNFITGTTRRAVQRATLKTLTDHGVDIASDTARRAAMQTPAIAAAVKTSQKLAEEGAKKLGNRLAQAGGAVALETIGEGAGEYLGELAATGKADTVEAVVEAFAGLGTSIGEIATTSALNRRGLKRLLDTPEEAAKTAEDQTKETGVEHEAIKHPTEPDKFAAVPKVRSVSGIELERDAEGNLKPVAPVSTQDDSNISDKPSFQRTAEDKINERLVDTTQSRIIIPGVEPETPSIAGRPVSDMSNNALAYTVERGSTRAQKIATDELARRNKEGVNPIIANATETPAVAVARIITTGRERAQEDAKNAAAPIIAPKTVKPTTAPKVAAGPVPKPKKAVTPVTTPKAESKIVPIVPVTKPTNKTNPVANVQKEPQTDNPPVLPKAEAAPQSTTTRRFDHGELNIKGRTNKIDRELDKYKKEQAALAKTKTKATAQQTKEHKALAKSLLSQFGKEIVEKHKDKFGEKELKKTLDQWSKWEPHKLISFVDKFIQEKVAAASKAETAKAEPAKPANNTNAKSNEKIKPSSSFDSKAWYEERNQRIKESRDGGNTHLDRVYASVETMRGKKIYSAHDPKERGTIRTVSNHGDIIVHWDDEYSGNKNLAQVKTEKRGRKVVQVLESWLSPSDHKDYVFAKDAPASPTKTEPTKTGTTKKTPPKPQSKPADSKLTAKAEPSKPQPTPETPPLRPHIADLIKRRAAASQTGKDRTVNNAIARAKEVMDGKRTDVALESKWFRAHAAAMRKADPDTADILSRISEAIKAQAADKKPAFSRAGEPQSKGMPRSEVFSIVKAIASKWANAPEINVVTDINDPRVPDEARQATAEQVAEGATGRTQGLYVNGTIYIMASEMDNMQNVVEVLFHEVLGHFGLRNVFGSDLDAALNQVANLRPRDVEAKAEQYGLDINNREQRLQAAEEVLAEMAQTNPKSGIVQRAIAAIRRWLRRNVPGFHNIRLTDGEIIEHYLVPARTFVQKGSEKAAKGGKEGTRLSRTGKPASSTLTPVRERLEKITDSLIFNFQDRFKPLKDIQKRAGPVPESEDASLAEERYSGMVRARMDTFEQQMRDPLLKAIHDSGVPFEEVEKYLHALHAPSRNAAMREINPTEAELKSQTEALAKQRDSLANDKDVKEFLKERRDLRQAEADIEDGIADESLAVAINRDIAQLRKNQNVKDYTEALDKLKALRSIKPFGGDNTALSGMSDAEAKAILAKVAGNGTQKALGRVSTLVDTITSRTRQIFVESGLEKADTIDAWNKKYEHYIPLHRDEVSGNTMPKIGQGFNIRGKESKRATGSTKEVTNILAHIVAQHEAAIIRAEKSKVDRALFQFAKTHPDPSLWTLDVVPMIKTVDPTSGLVVERVDPTYKNRDEVLTLKIDGEEHTITFNDQNLEAMRLASSMKNLSAQQLGEVTQMVGRFTRFLATMNTTANPVFVARNFLRDLQTAFVNLSDTEIAAKKKEVFQNIPAAIKGMWNLSRGKGNSQWSKYAQEFKNAGGQTGWMEHYKDIGARADSIKAELAAMQPGKANASRRVLKTWWQTVEDANNAVENGARLAAFVAARKAGLSEGKAASMAKNLTVNFNARGAKGVELNMWYMFMNASIQGTARLIKAMSNKQVRKIVAGVVLSGFLMDILARSMAGDDDDDGENDYDQLPEHTKSMNFVFMIDGQPVTLPMPYGYNFFASAGRKISEMMFRENYSAVRSAADLTGIFLDAFSPVGQAGSGLQYVAPTVADPFIQWAENKNFAGNPLRKAQNSFGPPKPEYQMGFKSTSAPAQWLAETLNNETGGNEVRPGYVDVNPAMFDFAVSSILGGMGRTYMQSVSGPIKVAGGDDLQAREIPFLNIFVGARPEHQTERKYFEAVENVERATKEISTYRQKGDTDMVRQIREDRKGELRLAEAAKTTKRILTHLRKSDHALDKTDPPNKKELRKKIEDRKREVMARFNKRYREATTAD